MRNNNATQWSLFKLISLIMFPLRVPLILVFVSPSIFATNLENLEGTYRFNDNFKGFYAQAEADKQGAGILSEERDSGIDSQKWEFEKVENNIYRIKSHGTERYLAAKNSEDKSLLALQNLNESWRSQQWVIESAKNCTFRLKNRWSGLYIQSSSEEKNYWKQRALEADWSSMRFSLLPLGVNPNTFSLCDDPSLVPLNNAKLLFKSDFEGTIDIVDGGITQPHRNVETIQGKGSHSKSDWFKTMIDQELIYDGYFEYALGKVNNVNNWVCLLYTSPSPRDLSTSRMPSSA